MTRHVANAACYAEVIKALVVGGVTVRDLIDASGLHENTVRKVLWALRRRHLAYRSDWGPATNGALRVEEFTFGPGKDAPRKRKCKNLVTREYYARKKAAKAAAAIVGALHA